MKSKANSRSGIFPLLPVFLTLGVVIVSSLYAQIGQTQVEQGLFRILQEKFEEAQKSQVNFYAPQNYQRAFQLYESARSDFRSGARLSVIREKIKEATEVLNRAFEATRISRVALEELVKTRSKIHEFGYNLYAPEEIARSERHFQQAILKAEEGNISAARAEAEQTYHQYRLATIKWLKDEILDKAEKDLRTLRRTVLPGDYERSSNNLSNLKNRVERSREERFDPFRFRDEIRARIKDILKPFYPSFYQNLPDTLLIGDFVLIVHAYSDSGHWEFAQKQAVGLSGTAWTSFNCGLFFIPVIPQGYLKVKNIFQVVPVVTNPRNQISLQEARLIQPDIQSGQNLELELVVKQDDPYGILNARQNLIAKLAPMPKKGDVLVHFDDVTIEPVTGRTEVGRIVQGMAAYPTQVPDPEIIKLNVAGFAALIDTLTLTKNLAKANIKLQFPDHVSSGKDCKPVSVSLGETTITSKCEFYVEKLNDTYGPFFIDDLGIKISGKGYVADFSTTTTYSGATPPLPASWMGIRFGSGETMEQPEFNPCNTGYLYGRYSFNFLTLTASGFGGDLTLYAPWGFTSLAPMNFLLSLQAGSLSIEDSKVKDGKFSGAIKLPNDVLSRNRSPIVATFSSLSVDKLLTLSGTIYISDELRWGGFGLVCGNGIFRLPAGPREFLSPVENDNFKTSFYTSTMLDTLTGLTIQCHKTSDTLFVYSADAKHALPFSGAKGVYGWLNLEMQGVTGYFYSIEEGEILKASLGDLNNPNYLAQTPFATKFIHSITISDSSWVKFWFAGNATFDADLRGKFDIAYPCAPTQTTFFTPPFKNMGVTSTATVVGGIVAFKQMMTLGYWGVGITSKRGVVSAKLGEIIYTNADIFEKVHFAKGFNIIWGEMLADGNLDEFYFNHNCAGQKFDGIPITVDSAALSKYDPALTGDLLGSLVVQGSLHFNFFGIPKTQFKIFDTNYLNHSISPYLGRLVTIDPEKFVLQRYWGSKLAYLDFKNVYYDSADQNGFVGDGYVDLAFFKDSPLKSSIIIDSTSILICISELDKAHSLDFEPVSLTALDQIWGCAYIEGDELKRMVIGGKLCAKAGLILVAEGGMSVESKMVVTPTITSFKMEGRMFLNIAFTNAELEGRIMLTHNRSVRSVEGDIQGKFNFDAYVGASAEAEGQLNWHFGEDYNFLQGRVSCRMLAFNIGGGLSGGVFLGINAPSSQAWVLHQGVRDRFGISPGNLPARLTGVYLFGDIEFSFSCGLFGGGIELYAGLGAFISPLSNNQKDMIENKSNKYVPFVVGNVGAYIHGEILGGLVAAAAWGNLQLAVGHPFYFEGTFGLRGCVLWVLCASVDVTAGISSERGFYID